MNRQEMEKEETQLKQSLPQTRFHDLVSVMGYSVVHNLTLVSPMRLIYLIERRG